LGGEPEEMGRAAMASRGPRCEAASRLQWPESVLSHDTACETSAAAERGTQWRPAPPPAQPVDEAAISARSRHSVDALCWLSAESVDATEPAFPVVKI